MGRDTIEEATARVIRNLTVQAVQKGLSPHARLLLFVIFGQIVGRKESQTGETGIIHEAELAVCCGLGVEDVVAAQGELERAGMIAVKEPDAEDVARLTKDETWH